MQRMNYITLRPFSANGSRTREPPKNKHQRCSKHKTCRSCIMNTVPSNDSIHERRGEEGPTR
ncbi:hypothetical protein BD779DRAFT_123499 [Infundibulicybe gibba]|nr:hypothetical protein BD779DRAFT_123499 [Infundibulicybe gibba]